jgi:hypothetical protein
MAIIKTVNWEGGSNARYDLGQMTPDERRQFDSDGRPLYSGAPGDGPDQWTAGLPGARGGSGPGDMGGGGGGVSIPGAAVYGQTAAAGLAEYKKALARLNQNRQSTLTQYGYAADIDPETGVMKNQRVDSSNPYGLYQGARRNNALQYLQLRDAAAERHLGGRGLGAQGISDARYGWGAADTAMAQALTQTQSGYDQEQQSAWQVYQNLLWQLELEAARAAAANGSYGYYDDGGDGGGGGGDYAGSQDSYDVPTATELIRSGAAPMYQVNPVRKAAPKPKVRTISPTKRVSRG